MNEVLLDKMLDRAEALEWICREEEGVSSFGYGKVDHYIEFERYTPAGEDFLFTVFYDKAEDLPREIGSYSDDFDLDDHVYLWLQRKQNGDDTVPGVVELVDDARWIQNEVERLGVELLHEKIRYKSRTEGITYEELDDYLRRGYSLCDIVDLSEGQCCTIFKADKFETGRKVLYIPDFELNEIDAYFCVEDPVEILSNCWTGDDFIGICGGDIGKAKKVFEYVDWQRPTTALDEMERNGDFDA